MSCTSNTPGVDGITLFQYKDDRNHDLSYIMADLSYIRLKVYFKPNKIHLYSMKWCPEMTFYEHSIDGKK